MIQEKMIELLILHSIVCNDYIDDEQYDFDKIANRLTELKNEFLSDYAKHN